MKIASLILLTMATININLARDINPHFQRLYHNKSRNLIVYGGAGSGKSHFVAQKWIARCLAEQGHKILVTRATRPAVKASCYPLVKHWLDTWGVPYTDNRSDLDIVIGKSVMMFRGYDDPEKLKSIEGVTGNWMEEPTELNREKFQQQDIRMRGNSLGYFQNALSFNPVSQSNWVYKTFFNEDYPSTYIDHSTYKDNAALLKMDPAYGERLESFKELDYYYYQVYCLGEWGVLSGLIYDNWEASDFDHKLSWYDAIVGGIDYGYNDPYTFALHGIKDGNAYVIDETYGSERTTPDISREMQQLCKRWGIGCGEFDIYSDHEPDRIDELYKDGFHGIREANKEVPVFNQITALKQMKVYVHKRCVNTIRERDGYKWRQDKDGNLMDKPLEKDDHCMDRTRYALYSHLNECGSQVFL